MSAPEIVGIGECLLRLAPSGAETLETAATYAVHVGGAEANVCANLARLGVRTALVTRLPANPLGRRVAETLRGIGMDVDHALWTPEGHMGLYFFEPDAAPRSGGVLYYRSDSAFSGIDPDAVDWDVLNGAAMVHLTGITPPLGAGPRALVERAIAEARRREVRISFDVNYRSTLWRPAAARAVLEPLLHALDIIFLNERDARGVFGVEGDPEAVAATLRDRFSCQILVLTLGAAGALAHDGRRISRHPALQATVIDRIGRGDAFASGFLYGYLRGNADDGVRYGVALAALKQTYPGDFGRATLADVEAVLGGRAFTVRR